MPEADLNMPPEVRSFLEDLLKEGGALPEADELKEMMLNDLFARLQGKLVLTLANYLDEKQLETYSRLAAMDPAQGNVYLAGVLPRYQALFLHAMAEFREVFLGLEPVK